MNVLRWIFRAALVLVIVDLFYLALVWPDWSALATGAIPKSNFIRQYEAQRRDHAGTLPAPRWQPVPLGSIPKHLTRAVIVAEDSRFYGHGGFDLIAFREAMDYNLEKGRFVFGGSTISQQTVKNLFLSRSRNPLRKWHELVLTWGMERHLSKRRILEIYLNVAELGRGIYGVQAAANVYWGVPVSAISVAQAAELAATLPGPATNNPAKRSRYFSRRAQRILQLMSRYPGEAAGAVGRIGASPAREDASSAPVTDPQLRFEREPEIEPEIAPMSLPVPEPGLDTEPVAEPESNPELRLAPEAQPDSETSGLP